MDKIIKSLDTGDLEIKSIDEKKRIIWHKISKEVTDRMGDIVVADGIDTRRFKKKPGVLADHNYYGGNPPPVIGEGIGFRLEGKTTYAGTRFLDPDNTEFSQSLRELSGDHYALHKMRLLGWSVGFIPLETEEIKNKDGGVTGYKFKKVELLEYSSVIIPANQEAVNDAISKGMVSKRVQGILPVNGDAVFFYKHIKEDEVDTEKVRAATEMAKFCGRRLGLSHCFLGWFIETVPSDPMALTCERGRLRGTAYVDSARIFIRSDLSTRDLQITVAHELYHLKYPKKYESDANKFASEAYYDFMQPKWERENFLRRLKEEPPWEIKLP